jgi:hypothetical protein
MITCTALALGATIIHMGAFLTVSALRAAVLCIKTFHETLRAEFQAHSSASACEAPLYAELQTETVVPVNALIATTYLNNGRVATTLP